MPEDCGPPDNPPSSPDILQEEPSTQERTTSTPIPQVLFPFQRETSAYPRKRQCPATPERHQESLLTSEEPLLLQTVQSTQEALDLALKAIIKAAALSTNPAQIRSVLDLAEVFRDYTESGRLNKSTSAVLASHVDALGRTARIIGSKANQIKTTPSPAPPIPANKPRTDQNQKQTTKPSFAQVAAQGVQQHQWTTVAPKKAKAPVAKKATLKDRQLVLQRTTQDPIDPLSLRNQFNKAFEKKGQSLPVIASVSLSTKKNIVLTTTPTFSGQFLLENKPIWNSLVDYQEASIIKALVQGGHSQHPHKYRPGNPEG